MSMQLVGPYMTTTQYNRKQKTSKSKKLKKAQVEHDAWLKKMGVKTPTTELRHSIPSYSTDSTNKIKTSDKICGHGPAKESMTYSGERQLLGIATMHKSNMVPIFADKKKMQKILLPCVDKL